MTADLAEAASRSTIPETPELSAWVQGLMPEPGAAPTRSTPPVSILTNLDIWEQLVDDVRARAGARRADLPQPVRPVGHEEPRGSATASPPHAKKAAAQRPSCSRRSRARPAGGWRSTAPTIGIAIGNGLRGTLRGLQTMARFARSAARRARPSGRASVPTIAAPGRDAGRRRRRVDAPLRRRHGAPASASASRSRPTSSVADDDAAPTTSLHRTATSSSSPTWRTAPSTARCCIGVDPAAAGRGRGRPARPRAVERAARDGRRAAPARAGTARSSSASRAPPSSARWSRSAWGASSSRCSAA